LILRLPAALSATGLLSLLLLLLTLTVLALAVLTSLPLTSLNLAGLTLVRIARGVIVVVARFTTTLTCSRREYSRHNPIRTLTYQQ